jgi:hypothetical protein
MRNIKNPNRLQKDFKMRRLRVGYILDNAPQSSIVWDLIERSKQAKHYSIELLLVQKTFRTESSRLGKLIIYLKRRGVKKFLERISFALIECLEKLIVKCLEKFKVLHDVKYSKFYKKHDLQEINIEKLYVNPVVSKSGFVYRYSEDDLAKIKEKNLDLLIRGGSGILRGGILDVCRFGIISFHHANNDVNRGGEPGFWEVYNREPSTGFVIQSLLNELDGGDVLFKGSIMTSPFYVLNLIKLYLKANVFLHITLEKIAEQESLPSLYPKIPYSYPLYTTPSISHQFRYVLKTFLLLAFKVLRRVQGKSFRWGVAYQFVESWKSAVLWKSKTIKNPPNRFLADPFVVYRDGSYVCYVEDFDYSTSKGEITAFEITEQGYRELGAALKEDFHLSYPFVFEDSGELFMCPETHESKDIRIYKCVNFPLNWSLHKILITGVSAVDTNIFKHGDKWWMLTNIDSSGLEDYGSELHLFYANTYDSSDWTPHPLNPVVFDSTKARNGGLLFDASGIYRVFQVQEFDMYGKAMGVSRITELTTNNYKEQVWCSISPKFFDDIKGTHTYSFADGLLVLDFVKVEKYKN